MTKLSISVAIIFALALLLCLIAKDAIITSSGYGVIIFETLFRVFIGIIVLAIVGAIVGVIRKGQKKRKQARAEAKARLAAMSVPAEVLSADAVTEKLRQYLRFDELRELVEQAEYQVVRIQHRRQELTAVKGVIQGYLIRLSIDSVTNSFRTIELNLWQSLLVIAKWMELYALASDGDTGNGEKAIAAIGKILAVNNHDIDACKQILVKLAEEAQNDNAEQLKIAVSDADAELKALGDSTISAADNSTIIEKFIEISNLGGNW